MRISAAIFYNLFLQIDNFLTFENGKFYWITCTLANRLGNIHAVWIKDKHCIVYEAFSETCSDLLIQIQTCFSEWPPLFSNYLYYMYMTLIFIYFPLQWISYKLNLYLATTCPMWPYFTVPLEGHIRQVWLYFNTDFTYRPWYHPETPISCPTAKL